MRNVLRDTIANGLEATERYMLEGSEVRRVSGPTPTAPKWVYNAVPDYAVGLAAYGVVRPREEAVANPLQVRLLSCEAPGTGAPHLCFASDSNGRPARGKTYKARKLRPGEWCGSAADGLALWLAGMARLSHRAAF